jgi:hypothetical protein
VKIKIPYPLVRAWDRMGDWSNVPVYRTGNFEIRRIDIFLTFGFLFSVAYYGYTLGWRGALLGGVSYLVVAAVCLWMI